MCSTPNTHHRLLDVNFLTTGQAEVCYLCHKVVPYKDVPGCQIPVDELVSGGGKRREEGRGEERLAISWSTKY